MSNAISTTEGVPAASPGAPQVLYISRIRLVDITCFSGETVIDLTRPSQTTPSWTLILGDNGTGKTSLLRAIAMGLADETSASGLLTELSGSFIREGRDKGIVELQLSSDGGTTYTVTTTFTKTNSGSEDVKQRTEPEGSVPRSQLFCCGYGATFGTTGSEAYEKYRLIDAVYTLFNDTARLQNPEIALSRISREKGVQLDDLLGRIDRVLMLPPNSTRLDSAGLRVSGPWGDFVPVGALGDGYKAVIAWICDMLGWSLLLHRSAFHSSIRGIVLRDEIEQHLHPSWQQAIVKHLSEELPGIQFIATTHAPLTAIGSTALHDESCQLVLLEYAGEGVHVRSGLRPPRHERADQVLTSYLFGLESTSSDDVVRAIERYASLRRLESLDSDQKDELQRLRKYLFDTLGSAETSLQQTVEEAVRQTLIRMSKEGATGEHHQEALSLEAQRQIRELLEPNRENS